MTSKLAIWRAVNSIHGDRLVEIAQEHMKLANEAIGKPSTVDLEIIQLRIDALRAERDGIIELYEEGEDVD